MEMNTEKRNRIMAAVTVVSVLLIVILAAILVYQMITMSVLDARRKQLREEYESIVAQKEDCESWLEYYYLNEDDVMYTLIMQQYGADVIK